MVNTMFCRAKTFRKGIVDIIQINLGDRCNQTCSHCHIGASPRGKDNMNYDTVKNILDKLLAMDVKKIEFTGGAPELNPNLPLFIEKLSETGKTITVRTNLTILDSPEYSSFIDMFRRNNVRLMASLPSVCEEITDKQRGNGVFRRSISVLKKLNESGYGGEGLPLDLVHNPSSNSLPGDQAVLEAEYRQMLGKKYGIQFNSLIAMVNSPINRFAERLVRDGLLEDYLNTLQGTFNISTMDNVMCRHLLSVDYEGYIHDCDFNLALGIGMKGYEKNKFWEIDFKDFNPEITFGGHCYACTSKKGSSCHGILIRDSGSERITACVQMGKGILHQGENDKGCC